MLSAKYNGKTITFGSQLEEHLFLTMVNDLAYVSDIEPSDYGVGFILKMDKDTYPFCTVYLDQHGTVTVYRAVNCRDAGIAIADEELIAEKQTVNGAISRIRELQTRYGIPEYWLAPPTASDGVLMQWKYQAFQSRH